jgi:hypothetical protein
MKKNLLVLFILLLSIKGFSQQFSQYNTGTLYDSFENPAQKTFTIDSSKMFASNFLLPNFNMNFYLSGNGQDAFKSRVFNSYYNTAALQIGSGKNNYLNINANFYSIMFKMFSSFSGNEELGFSVNTKVEARGIVSDETIALLNGPTNFPNNNYANVFNDNFHLQAYHQIGFTYREQVDKRLAIGIKFSALSGISYDETDVYQSNISFNKAADAGTISMRGVSYSSGSAGKSFAQSFLPTFLNPGASISLGTTYRTRDGFTLQGNIKDLGFIHWNNSSAVYNFNNFGSPVTIKGLSTPFREDSIYNKVHYITRTNPTTTGFTTPTNGLVEISASRSYWLDYDNQFKFSPTLIASKELFYTGFTAALVTPVQYQNYSVTLTSSYSDLKLFDFGGQFMIKSPNGEFFIGSERLFQTGSLIASAFSPKTAQNQTYSTPAGFTGADFFIGFSVKFGPIIEPPMNSNHVPNGEKGLIGRMFDRIFPKTPIGNY